MVSGMLQGPNPSVCARSWKAEAGHARLQGGRVRVEYNTIEENQENCVIYSFCVMDCLFVLGSLVTI